MATRNTKEMNVQVFVRVRPINQMEKETENVVETFQDTVVVQLSDKPGMRKSFGFNGVFGPYSSQGEVYNSVVGPMIYEVLAGYNCTVFAYGQTGTGKTFTMEGTRSNNFDPSWDVDPLWGMVPRASSQLFDELNVLGGDSTVRVSYVELYNEDVIDLLSTSKDVIKLRIFEDTSKKGTNMVIQNLEEVVVPNKMDLLKILDKGSSKRQKAHTLLNANSSRSHTIFTITVITKEVTLDGQEFLKTGKLNLVDLAGSENIGRSGAVDKRARDAANINQSLLTLGRVISSIVAKAPHIPYRESKLTRILQDSLGGSTRTSMVATISPSVLNMDDTLNTLDYATRAKCVTNRPIKNVKLSKEVLLRGYVNEIEQLRKDLQQAREKDGVYLSLDQFNELKASIRTYQQELLEKTTELTKDREKQQDLRSKLEKLNVKCQTLDEEREQLTNKVTKLNKDRDEARRLVLEQERALVEQENEFTSLLDSAFQECNELHSKLERKRKVEDRNSNVATSFQEEFKENLEKVTFLSIESQKRFHEYQKSVINPINSGFSSVEKVLNCVLNRMGTQEIVIKNAVTTTQRYLELQNENGVELGKVQNKLEDMENYSKSFYQEIECLIRTCLDNLRSIMSCSQKKNSQLRDTFSSVVVGIQELIEHLSFGQSAVLDALKEATERNEKAKISSQKILSCEEDITELYSNISGLMNVLGNKLSFLKDSSEEHNRDLLSVNNDSAKVAFQEYYSSTKGNLDELSSHCGNVHRHIKEELEILQVKISENINYTMEGLNSTQENYRDTSEAFKDVQMILTRQARKKVADCPHEKMSRVLELYHDVRLAIDNALSDIQQSVETSNSIIKTSSVPFVNSQSDLQLKLENVSKKVFSFINHDLKKDIPTGNTPEKRVYKHKRMYKPSILETSRLSVSQESPKASPAFFSEMQ